ncbi:hypothetical protein G7Y89_g7040 [Cudoniella acicularis]|uniref:Uncharacterized protein n=1 Tax=Cudoniella acicularis TaxID=354080 RepID=A0A8H4RJA9_9HELO|nr:hypothetical protein G7Y89_g7040 [Cudoniella acicularis]
MAPNDFFKPQQVVVFLICDMGMNGLVMSWFETDKLPSEKDKDFIDLMSKVAQWPEFPPDGVMYVNAKKVTARLAREVDSPRFGFQVNAQTRAEPIVEHFKLQITK